MTNQNQYIYLSYLVRVIGLYAIFCQECHCMPPVRFENDVQARKELALSQADTLRIQAMIATLKETSRYHASLFADVDFKLLTKMVLHWPVENIFPGINSACSHFLWFGYGSSNRQLHTLLINFSLDQNLTSALR